MTFRKFDELAANLDDLSLDVEEIKDDPHGLDPRKLDCLEDALDNAKEAIDDMAESEDL